MGGIGKVCDSCKSATASVFCRADSAYLCMGCDSKVHAANKLASRHARVWVCEVCEQSPATVTCKADAAHLCSSCDRDIHSANPLARRHERVPLSPFFDITTSHPTHTHEDDHTHSAAANAAKSAAISKLFGDDYYSDADEAEAASWLLHNPNPNPSNKSSDPNKSIDYLFSGGANDGDDIDPYLDLDFSADPKPDPSSDGVVPDPDHKQTHHHLQQHQHQHQSLYSLPAASYHHNHFDAFDHGAAACKPYSLPYNPHTQPSMSHSVSSSSLDFGVVPDASAVGDGQSTGMEKNQNQNQQMKVIGLDREARVLRYREKRKNRKFEKTIRYASRKAYAETRPRIKGRFAKRTETEPTASVDSLFASDPGYGVVPSF